MGETMEKLKETFTKRLSANSASRTPRPHTSQYSNNHNKEHLSRISLSILDYVIRAATVPLYEHGKEPYKSVSLSYIINSSSFITQKSHILQ
ncbi:hypothetical protein NEPAR08_2434 [Nematocida parisii]|nr:hypothetical protein NEPAR03_2408 [Nematocida parisii]KAI5131397.1 hypothetical protein NEPAR08_2434 [Nematocida parisii]